MHAHRKLKTLAPMVILAIGNVSTTDTKRVIGFLLISCVNSISDASIDAGAIKTIANERSEILCNVHQVGHGVDLGNLVF